MQLQRNEILTGLLVLATIAVLTGILILLGAPGLFRPLVTYRIYMDNAAGIKQGAPVLLAGRKIGQVDKLYSPVSKEDAARAEAAAAALHGGDPCSGTRHVVGVARRIDQTHNPGHHRGIVDIRVVRIAELKRPSAPACVWPG